MRTFVVNGKEYVAREFDFNLICDLEDMGVSMAEIATKPMSTVRAYFALCTRNGKAYAGKELENHMINGGNFDDLVSVMNEEMEKSDFFCNLSKNAETEVGESAKEKKQK